MLTPEAKADIETQIATAEERLGLVDATYPLVIAGAAQEAALILAQVEKIAESIQVEDPAYYSYLTNRIQAAWANFLRRTNMSGLGDCADVVLRDRLR